MKTLKDEKFPVQMIFLCIVELAFAILVIIGMGAVHTTFTDGAAEADAASGWYVLFFGPLALGAQFLLLTSLCFKGGGIVTSIVSMATRNAISYIITAVTGIGSSLWDAIFFCTITVIYTGMQIDAYTDPGVLDPTHHDWVIVNGGIVISIFLLLKLVAVLPILIVTVVRAVKVIKSVNAQKALEREKSERMLQYNNWGGYYYE